MSEAKIVKGMKAFCNNCGELTVPKSKTMSQNWHVLHGVMTVFSFGVWLPGWLMFFMLSTDISCSVCGRPKGMLTPIVKA